MIQVFLNTPTAVAAGAAIPFTDTLANSFYISHSSNSTEINIRYPGIYIVQFNADVTSTTTDPVTLQLRANGTAVSSGKATATITAGEIANLSFSTFINAIQCGYFNTWSRTLDVTSSAAVTVNYANMLIWRIK